MSLRRMAVSVQASLNRVFRDIENHEAVAESAVCDLKERLARTVAQLHRLQRIGLATSRDLERAQRDATLWRQRAQSASDDEQALECLRRHKQHNTRVRELETRLAEHDALQTRLRRDVQGLEERYREMRSRKESLRARESRALACEIASQECSNDGLCVEEAFERWETKVIEREYLADLGELNDDDLHERLASAEERFELLQELRELRGEHGHEK